MFRQLVLLSLLSLVASEPFLCAEDLVVNRRFKDKRFTDGIVKCLMDEKPCEGQVENQIKSECSTKILVVVGNLSMQFPLA